MPSNTTYFRKLKLIKRLLLGTFSLLIFVLALWLLVSFIFNNNISILNLITGNLSLANNSISLAGITSSNVKYSVVAKSVKNYANKNGAMELVSPIIKIVASNNKDEVTISGQEALLDSKNSFMKLSGNIVVKSTAGYIAYLDSADFDYKNNLISSNSVAIIEGNGINMTIINGFVSQNLGKKIRLNGPIDLNIDQLSK